MDGDLVLFALSGVQRFISESRTTADVANGSRIVQRLAAAAARSVGRALAAVKSPYGVIYPVLGGQTEPDGITSKIAFLAAAGSGPGIAVAAAGAVAVSWGAMVGDCYGSAAVPETPGFPDVWWVSVTGGVEDDYQSLWKRAAELADARRQSRVYGPVLVPDTWLCSQSPRLPSAVVPAGARRHERRERLSAAGWVKRTQGRSRGALAIRSTSSIASTRYRARLLAAAPAGLSDHVAALDAAARQVTDVAAEAPVTSGGVPGGLAALNDRLGSWVYPEVWDAASLRREYRAGVSPEAAGRGRAAAQAIARIAVANGIRRPTPYYAVVMQDIDRLGVAMSGLTLADQRAASQQLVELAEAQRARVHGEAAMGIAVYAGGDDLLAFCPASTAMRLAQALRDLLDTGLRDGPLATAAEHGRPVTASTVVVFAHMSSPLQSVVAQVRHTMEAAKTARLPGGGDRDALAVVALRRGGERARSIQPWRIPGEGDAASSDPVSLLEILRPAPFAVSGGLASQLELDEAELAALAAEPSTRATGYRELARLVSRRGGTPEHAAALHRLAWHERHRRADPTGAGRYRPVAPLLVARFLAQECGEGR